MGERPSSWRGGSIVVERRGSTVTFKVKHADEYEAMRTYDLACRALKETGTLALNVEGAVPARESGK